jgi:hypothetical protein
VTREQELQDIAVSFMSITGCVCLLHGELRFGVASIETDHGRPAAVTTVQRHVVNGPISDPIRITVGARRQPAVAIAAGSVVHRPRNSITRVELYA